jgi:hypothetical protein
VPDLDSLINGYDPSCPDAFVETAFEASQKRDKNRHHWLYNEVSLSAALRAAGFTEIHRRPFGQGLCPDVTILDLRPESLFMEAWKSSSPLHGNSFDLKVLSSRSATAETAIP